MLLSKNIDYQENTQAPLKEFLFLNATVTTIDKLKCKCQTLTTVEYAANMMTMIRRNPVMSLQAFCSVAMKMFILGFNLSRRQSFSVDSSTRKAIRYWSVESAMAVS